MNHPRILTIQDISCVGQCSSTVALPSAILSTHTAGFTVRDLTEYLPPILAHWQKACIPFQAIYTGYLTSTQRSRHLAAIFDGAAAEGCVRIADPAMADNGSLYPAFGGAKEQRRICGHKADPALISIPGIKRQTSLCHAAEASRVSLAEYTPETARYFPYSGSWQRFQAAV